MGTGQARNSEFYIDNISIQPTPEGIINGIKIDGNNINGFTQTVFEYDYFETELNSNTNVELTTHEYYDYHTVKFVPTDGVNKSKLVITVYDVYGKSIIYTIINNNQLESIDDFVIVNSNGTTLSAEKVIYEGKEAIKLKDYADIVGLNNAIYMYKKFDPQKERFIFSYEVNIPNNEMQNKWNRVQLSNEVPTSLNDVTNVGVETYLNKQEIAPNNVYLISRSISGNNSSNDITYTNSPMVTDQWHKVAYDINIKTKTYDMYIDSVKIATDVLFKSGYKSTSLDTMLFSTGGSTTSEIYFANEKITTIYGAPSSGIKVEGKEIANFSQDNYEYSYYSSQEMTNTFPTVEIIKNENFKSVTYSRNNEEQTITIKAINLSDEEYIYTVSVKTLLDRQITAEQLQTLIDKSYADYPDTVKNDYVEKGWDGLRDCLIEAQTLIDSENTKAIDYAMAYYKIEQALTKMIKYKSYDYNSGIIEIIRYSEDLDNLFSIENVLENGIEIYKNSAEAEKFYSVPFKMWNAEYIKMDKTFKTDVGGIQFRALVDLDVFIGYDRTAGTLLAEGFKDTGDIITSTNETVYKVYKRHYNKNDIVVLDFETCIQNSITGKNSIVAVMDSTQSNNDVFLDSNSNVITTETLKKLWNVVTPEGNVMEIAEHNGENVLRFESTTNLSMGYMYKRFAKLSDKFEFSFSILNPGKFTNADDNRWSRTWLLKGMPVDPNKKDAADKNNILMETYIDNNNLYKNDQVKINSDKYFSSTKLDFDQWNTITYNYDLTNKRATVTKNGTSKYEDISSYFKNDLDYIDYVTLYTRKAGRTWLNFKNLKITPITRDIIKDIKIDGTTIGSDMYYPLTRDYLYKYDKIGLIDPENYVTVDEGTVYGNTSTIMQKTSTTNYAKINLVDGSGDGYTFENRVYLELNVDKSVLSEYINEANNLDEYLYTKDSWEHLQNALIESIAILKDLNETQTSIDAQAAVLRDKINSLVLKTDKELSIQARVYYGKDFDFSELQNGINMTNDSSITISTEINKILEFGYPYENQKHVRKIITSETLPVNTKITIMDNTTDDIKYYYYIVTSTDFTTNKKEYLLSDFIKMGTTNEKFTKEINYDSTMKEFKEQITFIIDYEDVIDSNKLSTDSYKFIYDIQAETGEIKMDPASIRNTTYNLYDIQKQNTLETSKNSAFVFQGEDVELSLSNIYQAICPEETKIITDTTLKDKKMGIIVTLLKGNSQIAFPTGISGQILTNDDNTISESSINAEGQMFIMYEENVTSVLSGKTLKIKQAFENLIQSGNYQIKLELFQSYDGLNYGKVMSSKIVDLEIADNIGYGLKADIDDSTKPTINSGETTILPIKIIRSVEDETVDVNKTVLTVELTKKNDLGQYETMDISKYVTQPELLIMNSARNEYIINFELNKEIINLKVLGTLQVGTYRLQFNIYSPNDLSKSLASDVENFIVK